MNINLRVTGIVEQIIDEMITRGYAATKTEAIRIAVLDYKHHHLKENEMSEEDIRDFELAVRDYKTGKAVSLEKI